MKLTKDRLINMRLKEIIEFRYLDECKKTTDFAKKTDKLFGTAHVTISLLDKLGYIERKSSTRDKRVREIVLTDKGRKLVELTKELYKLVK